MAKQFQKASDNQSHSDPLKDNLTSLALAVTKEALKPETPLDVRLEALKIAGAHYTNMKRVSAEPVKDGDAFDAYRKSLEDAEGSGSKRGGTSAGGADGAADTAGADAAGGGAPETGTAPNVVRLERHSPSARDCHDGDEDSQ